MTRGASSSSTMTVAALVTLLLVLIVEIDARKGCKSYGHSCYGGTGKRSDSEMSSSEDSLEEIVAVGNLETMVRSEQKFLQFWDLMLRDFRRRLEMDYVIKNGRNCDGREC